MIAMGSLAMDSISAIDVTLLFIERVRKIEKTAAASVDDIIAHITRTLRMSISYYAKYKRSNICRK